MVDLIEDIHVQGFWPPFQPSQLPLLPQQSQQSQSQYQSQFWGIDSYGSNMGSSSFFPPQGVVSSRSLTSLSSPQDFLSPQNVLSSHAPSPPGVNNFLPPQGGSAYVNIDRDGLALAESFDNNTNNGINYSTATNDSNTTSTNTTNTNNLDYEEIHRLILAELSKPAQSNI